MTTKKAPVTPAPKPRKAATKKTVAKKPAVKRNGAKTRRKPSKRSAKPSVLKKLIGRLLASKRLLLKAAVVIGIIALFLQGIPQYYFNQFTADKGLLVNEIIVVGRKYADADEVKAALNIALAEPMAQFDPEQAHQNLKDVRWVESARVQRLWPDKIKVTIKERTPIAIVKSDKRKDHLVDRQGKSLGAVTRQFKTLPQLKGIGAGEQALTLLALLESHGTLEEKLKYAERIGKRRWNLHFLGDLEVRLPEKNPQMAWDRLAQLARRREIFDGSISRIDLRIPDRMVLKQRLPQ